MREKYKNSWLRSAVYATDIALAGILGLMAIDNNSGLENKVADNLSPKTKQVRRLKVEDEIPELKEAKEDENYEISNQGLELIKQNEGFSSEIYLCPAGKSTIGYGHVVHSGENYENITKQEAENLLKKDLFSREKTVRQNVNVDLTQNQYDALCSFVYNIGEEAFRNSTLLEKLNSGDYKSASDEFDRWVYGDGKKLRGLENRRQAESELFNK